MEKIKEWEIICPTCEGTGYVYDEVDDEETRFYIHSAGCPKCMGNGKLDWLENIFGKKNKTHKSIMKEIINRMSQQIAENIDKEIIGAIQNGKFKIES